MKEYRKILKSVSAGNFPDEIDKETYKNFDFVVELYEASYLTGNYEKVYGGAFLNGVQITVSGREYLDDLKRKKLKPIIIFFSWLSGIFTTVLVQYLVDLLKTANK